jgi:anti-sigma B factor antagonist
MKKKMVRKIIINLDAVEYIDSTGVGTLIFIYSEAKEANIELFMTNIHGTVQKVLTLTKLLGYFPIKADIKEALQSL